MASSKQDIINQSLVILGEKTVSDLTSPVGIVADTLYKTTRDDLLQDHRWRFAVKKVLLVVDAGDPLNEWTHKYSLPSDILLLIRTYPNSVYEIFEDKLFINSATAPEIDYVYDPGEKMYPAYFVKALAHRLASCMALSITNDKKLFGLIDSEAVRAVSAARFKDSQGRRPTAIQHRPFIDVRG